MFFFKLQAPNNRKQRDILIKGRHNQDIK